MVQVKDQRYQKYFIGVPSNLEQWKNFNIVKRWESTRKATKISFLQIFTTFLYKLINLLLNPLFIASLITSFSKISDKYSIFSWSFRRQKLLEMTNFSPLPREGICMVAGFALMVNFHHRPMPMQSATKPWHWPIDRPMVVF